MSTTHADERNQKQGRDQRTGPEALTPSANPMHDVLDYLSRYTRQNPREAALICLGVGFVLGWKLKPW